MRVQGEDATFNVLIALKHPRASDSCFHVKEVDSLSSKGYFNDPFELSLIQEVLLVIEEEKVIKIVNF